jgi:hypothetical protein
VEKVITATLEQAPPGGDTHWSTRSMARSAGMSESAVSRIWRALFPVDPVLGEVDLWWPGAGLGRGELAKSLATRAATPSPVQV